MRRSCVRRDASLSPQAYRLTVNGGRATIESGDAAGAFYGAMTLAQLPQREGGSWTMPCVSIEDRPALRWRVLSDDVSRGPLPTMHYFEERIRTIAAFKMNGYSPYMEHVFVSPTDPLPAPLDGITPAQLRDLTAYAKRFHVSLIPEQQTFAHMHNTLKLERYAPAAELPHGFLLAPNVPLSSSTCRASSSKNSPRSAVRRSSISGRTKRRRSAWDRRSNTSRSAAGRKPTPTTSWR